MISNGEFYYIKAIEKTVALYITTSLANRTRRYISGWPSTRNITKEYPRTIRLRFNHLYVVGTRDAESRLTEGVSNYESKASEENANVPRDEARRNKKADAETDAETERL